MAASKQFFDTALDHGGDQLESPSDSIETIFSTVSNPSRREETLATLPRAHGSNGTKRSVHREEYSLRFERRADFQKKSKLSKHDSERKSEGISTELSKAAVDASETSLEEDWVGSQFLKESSTTSSSVV